MKAMISLLIIITISVASADVNINRELYTSGGEVQEELSLQGTNYQNDIYISVDSVFESATFEPYSDTNSIDNNININSGGRFGTNVNLKGQELKGSRQLSAGSSQFLALDYEFSNGESESASYSSQSSGRERLELENAHYTNSIMATPTSFYHTGTGIGLLSGDYQINSINHYIELAHKGKYSEINLQIDSIKDEGIRPASYSWGAGVGGGTDSLGFSSIAVGTSAGDSQMDVEIQGKSSELPSKQVSRHIYPLMLDETIQEQGDGWFDDADVSQMIDLLLRSGVSQNIYMTYTIE
ncbi:MAG: hypothetical protein ACYDHX_12180 [Methanothrix sp.]